MPFPTIRHIDDVLPAIKGRDEFTVGSRDGYQFIDYNYVGNDTFDCPIRRECRGLKFDMDGKLIARPFHKFFNLHEKPSEVPTLSGDNHTIMEKLDGSMIHAAILGGKIVWMTRAGITEQALQAKAYVDAVVDDVVDDDDLEPNYYGLAQSMLQCGWTPIFEFTSPQNQIVIRYTDTKMTMIGARRMVNGFYMPHDLMEEWAAAYGVPVIRTFDPTHNLDEFVAYAKSLTDTEGFVIRCGDWMGKVKADAYVASHRAKSGLLWEKDVLRLVLDQKVDDVCGLLPVDDREYLEEWANKVNSNLNTAARIIRRVVDTVSPEGTPGTMVFNKGGLVRPARKTFAAFVKDYHTAWPFMKSAMFAIYDGKDAQDVVRDIALKQTSSTQKARDFLAGINVPEWVPVRTMELAA
jgi:RNA ligase